MASNDEPFTSETHLNGETNGNLTSSNDDDNEGGLIGWINSIHCWTNMPFLHHSSWFCVGIYVILMLVIPFVKDGSTSIVFCLNILVFLCYIYWYPWYCQNTMNESIQFLSAGFYVIGSISFIFGIATYYFTGLPTNIYCYNSYYLVESYETYEIILYELIISFICIALTQEYLKYYLLTKGSNLECMDFNQRCITNQIIGSCIGIGIGSIMSINTISTVLLHMQWQSRIELWCINLVWALPLTICTSYLIGAGIADREILGFRANNFTILFLPILYSGIANFNFLILISLHNSIHARLPTLIGSMIMNIVVGSAAILEVWQRYHVLTTKQRLRQNYTHSWL